METMGLLGALISIVVLIVFFVMAAALSNISSRLSEIKKILADWQGATGYGLMYTCITCKKPYKGKQERCPHCGAEKMYT